MSAIISPCGKYRYRLDRTVGMDGPVYAFFGINPSTADASLDDATVRKWIGFTKVWGGSRFIVGNVFAYRATDVRDLVDDPCPAFSIENQTHLKAISAEADILVPCWGNTQKAPAGKRHIFSAAMHLLIKTGKPIKVFGLTKSGDPMHPLMLGYSTQLQEFSEAAKQGANHG